MTLTENSEKAISITNLRDRAVQDTEHLFNNIQIETLVDIKTYMTSAWQAMISAWQAVVVLSVIGSALTGLWFLYNRFSEISSYLSEFFTPDLIDGIFGNSGINPVDDSEFENLIKSHADNASKTIDRISVHMYTVDKRENKQFKNPNVDHRILLLKPTKDAETGRHAGYETDLLSPYDDNDLLDIGSFKQPFRHIYHSLEHGDWESVEVKLYETTPWIRGAIIDRQYAGLIFVPTIQGGREAQKFWTENTDTVEIFIDIFEDMWTDDRSSEFCSWYEEWEHSEVESKDS